MFCVWMAMLKKIARLFTVKTKFEAFLLIYALALGAVQRGRDYMVEYPGFTGQMLFAACACAVFMAGGKILEAVAMARERGDY